MSYFTVPRVSLRRLAVISLAALLAASLIALLAPSNPAQAAGTVTRTGYGKIYFDNFNRASIGSQYTTSGVGTNNWSLSGNRARYTATGAFGQAHLAESVVNAPANSIYEVTFNASSFSSVTPRLLAQTNGNNYYWYNSNFGSRALLLRTTNGQNNTRLNVAYSYNTNTDYRVKMKVGTNVSSGTKLWLNNVLLGSNTDTAPLTTAGQAALWVADYNSGPIVYFDDLSVYANTNLTMTGPFGSWALYKNDGTTRIGLCNTAAAVDYSALTAFPVDYSNGSGASVKVWPTGNTACSGLADATFAGTVDNEIFGGDTFTYSASAPDTTPPTVSMTAPTEGAVLTNSTPLNANASDNIAVAGVQFKVDGNNFGAEDTTSPYSVNFDTTTVSNGSHTVTATARDAAGNTTTASAVNVTVNNPVAAPTISSFTANPTSIITGSSSTLSWSVANADSLSIDQGIGAVTGTSRAVSPTTTTTYTLTATNSGGSSVATVTVTVNPLPAPVINSFSVSPSTIMPGQSATLSWSTSNASSVSINQGIGSVPVTGTRPVGPTVTTTYTLTASNGTDIVTAVVTLNVTNLLGAWNFDEGNGLITADSSGNSRTGTLSGPEVSWISGKFGNALNFNGASGYVDMGDVPSPQNVTLEAWIFPQVKTNEDGIIIDKSNSEYNLRLLDNGTLFAGSGDGAFLNDPSFNFHSPANTNQWYHIVYTFNDATDTQRLYRNGMLVASGTNTGSIANTGTSLWIGRHSQYNFGTFFGKIDHARIYARELSSSEVLANYNEGQVPDPTPPTVSITAPANSATVSGSIAVTANAADNVGVTKVELYVDGVLQNTDFTSPYAFTWDTTAVSNTSHTLVAKAYDAAGNTTDCVPVSVTVLNNPAVPLPSGQLTRVALPMLPQGPAGSIDDDKTGPRVILAPGTPAGSTNYRMYYEAVPGPNQAYVGYATSDDGITWVKQGQITGLDPSAAWETGFGTGEVSPNSILVENGVYKLWYHAHDANGIRRIGYAESTQTDPASPDGRLWVKSPNFVVDVGTSGSYDEQFVAEPRVFRMANNTYRMYYSAKRFSDTGLSGYTWTYATSSDGLVWTKTHLRLMEGTDARFSTGELHGAGHGMVWDGTTWHTWYETGDQTLINYASSTDGLTWTRGPSNPVLTLNSDQTKIDWMGIGDSVSAYKIGNEFRVMYTGSYWRSPTDRGEAICLANIFLP